MNLIKPVTFALVITLAIYVFAQDKSEQPLAEFSFMVGHWRGEGLGGICEETWLPETGGMMLGTFKLVQNGQVSFFEMMSLSIDSIGPAIRVKHFDSDMTAWEEKADMAMFRLDSTANDNIYFDGATYKPRQDSLVIEVALGNPDGTVSIQPFKLARVGL